MSRTQAPLHREPRSRRWRLGAGAVVIPALVISMLGVAACGSGTASPPVAHAAGSSTTAVSGNNALLLATRCLRQHGLPGLPDPIVVPSGPAKGQMALDKPALLAYPSSVVTQAVDACRSALAQAGMHSGPGQAPGAQELHNLLAFARCVRNHGIPNFPDPNSQGGFNLAGTGINSHQLSPSELAAARTCLPAARGAVHIPPQGTATANTGQ
jgi:hypothetical protein